MTNAHPAIIQLAGELDVSRKHEVRSTLRSPARASSVLLDMTDVTYADSTALSELLRFCIDLEKAGIPVALVVVAPQFDRIVQYAGLADTFRVFRDRTEATAFLERAAP